MKTSPPIKYLPYITLLFLFVLTRCTFIDNSIKVERKNPEIVLRAYFDAWERGEWQIQQSMMDEKYLGMAPESVENITIISINPIASYTKEDHNYRVILNIEVVGQGVSMQTGKYDWNYYLRWNDKRNSWLIITYGVG
jgi:hypothetical protein